MRKDADFCRRPRAPCLALTNREPHRPDLQRLAPNCLLSQGSSYITIAARMAAASERAMSIWYFSWAILRRSDSQISLEAFSAS
jgi:hypothetical protein